MIFGRTINFSFFVFCSTVAWSQTEAADYSRIGHGTFFTSVVQDYQCVGINPANLGFAPENDLYRLSTPMTTGIERSKKPLAITIMEGGTSVHSDALPRSGLIDMLLQTNSIKLSSAEKLTAAQTFAEKGIRFGIDLMAIGVSYQTDEYGGVAFTVRERISGAFRFNEGAARLAFEGRHYDYFDSTGLDWRGDTVGYSTNPKNFSELFKGTRLTMLWFREIGLSYGRSVFKSEDINIYVGASAKYLMGYAYLDSYTENNELYGKSALSPLFGINYKNAVSPSQISGSDFDPVGSGWGLDLGATVQVDDFTMSIAIVDMGAITWDGNVYQARDTILNGMTSEGFDSYNIFLEAPKITGDGNYFKWDGLQTATSELPTRIRIGGSYRYSSVWKFGTDAVIPVNNAAGASQQAVVTGGAEYRPTPWFTLGFGIGGGGDMGFFIPLSLGFSVLNGMWEFGIASRDVLLYVTETQPVVGFAMGFARFRF